MAGAIKQYAHPERALPGLDNTQVSNLRPLRALRKLAEIKANKSRTAKLFDYLKDWQTLKGALG